jgi:hypothetical protein
MVQFSTTHSMHAAVQLFKFNASAYFGARAIATCSTRGSRKPHQSSHNYSNVIPLILKFVRLGLQALPPTFTEILDKRCATNRVQMTTGQLFGKCSKPPYTIQMTRLVEAHLARIPMIPLGEAHPTHSPLQLPPGISHPRPAVVSYAVHTRNAMHWQVMHSWQCMDNGKQRCKQL